VLPVREQDRVIHRVLQKRLDTLLPVAMREAGIDLWLILCQEDDPDPVFRSMMPMDTWTPILQMLLFHDRGEAEGVERVNYSMTDTQGLFDQPWSGSRFEEQWTWLRRAIEERDPRRIGINVGSVAWAAGGLTHNLHAQITALLPHRYVERLVSAEAACTRWLMTLTEDELELFPHAVSVSRAIIAECYDPQRVVPGVITTEDLQWHYWQRCADLGLEPSFKPSFSILRSSAEKARHPTTDRVIRRGDVLHCDVGLRYLRLTTDHQELAYVRREGEEDAPEGLRRFWDHTARLRGVFMAEFQRGLTGNELLKRILTRAREEGIPGPKVYGHSLGLLLHQPGPLIGLPWEQECCPGRGDVKLEHNTCYTMELSIAAPVPEWDNQEVRFPTEQDVAFTEIGCHPIGGLQTGYHLV
jgi:hypothetical protein